MLCPSSDVGLSILDRHDTDNLEDSSDVSLSNYRNMFPDNLVVAAYNGVSIHHDISMETNVYHINPFTDDISLTLSKLKPFADDKLNVLQMIKFVLHRV